MQKGVGRGWFRTKKGKKVYCWYNDRGEERSRVIGNASMSDEEGWLAVAGLKLHEQVGRPDPKHTLFGEVLQSMLATCKSKTGAPKAPSTITTDLLRAKQLAVWSNRVAKDIQPLEIQAWLDQKTKGVRPKLRSLMSSTFRFGQKMGMLPRDQAANPMQWVSAPVVSDFEAVSLSPAECGNILSRITDPLVRVLVILIAATGMRISEALGLCWSDFDFHKAVLRIRRSWTHGRIGPPKSKQSKRPVVMTAGLAAVLQAWRRETKYAADNDYVFASSRAKGKKPRESGILVTDYIRPAAIAAEVLTIRDGLAYYDGERCLRFGAHNMRHGLASWLAEQGTDPKLIQHILGHSTPEMTLHYIHGAGKTREMQERFIEQLLPSSPSKSTSTDRENGHCGITLRERSFVAKPVSGLH